MKTKTTTKKYTPKDDSDDLNEIFIFGLTATDLLVAIVNGEIDSKELALQELKNRGLNEIGLWVGFKKN